MPTPFRFILLLSCAWLLAGLAGCGVFKNGDCDCPAFSETESQTESETDGQTEQRAEPFAVNSPE